MNDILIPVLILAAIGLLAGLILAIASIVMAVPKDQKAEDIRAMLPGANCGACGFSGCDGYAKALADGTAQPGLCTVGGSDVSNAIASYLGVAAASMEPHMSIVRCLGSHDNTTDRAEYEGMTSCAAAVAVAGGPASCTFGCIGLGDCVNACQYNALSVRNGVAMVEPKNCVACGMCLKACPRHLLTLVPVKKQAVVLCSNCDKGNVTNKVCKVGCIGCKKCERTCEHDAIHVDNFLATVDAEKCVGCGECVDACPRHIIDLFNVE
ncbi:MAG: RnfABCDGE type electron transport complex subunit B [Oscillospiraceae bacterium]|jgi:RnfABCDGE-type electron transport complex B subunit|nr:RnfABCDGE type electron transport complex subunit B [Oscillospiraceae bacterium]